tara:strand:- start:571 stop:798 length:228 start_codon:yes stop_codon:yes gene_type:complete
MKIDKYKYIKVEGKLYPRLSDSENMKLIRELSEEFGIPIRWQNKLPSAKSTRHCAANRLSKGKASQGEGAPEKNP